MLIGTVVFTTNRSLAEQKSSIKTEVENTVTEVETRIKAGVGSIIYLKATAGEIYRNQNIPLKQAKKVKEINKQSEFALEDPSTSNLTGFGGLDHSKKLLHEMASSLELTPYFKIVKELNPSFVQVYYASKHNFATRYPFSWSDQFIWRESMLSKKVWTKALPENNKEGTLFVTPLHKEKQKQRLVVTIGQPFYYQKKFLGTVNLDITVTPESRFLDSKNLHNGTYVIVNKEGEIIAASGLDGFTHNTIYTAKELVNMQILKTPVTETDSITIDNDLIYVKQFSIVPWQLYYIKSKTDIYLNTLYFVGMMVLVIILLLGVKILIRRLSDSRNELERQALTDPMTKLYNRRYIAEITPHLIGLAQRNETDLSVIILDIDKFKNVNDTYGHKVGDDVIILLSQTLQKHTRQSDVVCRFGGEEFVILLPETPADGAFSLAETLRVKVEELVVPLENDQTLRFTISMGVSLVSSEDKNLDTAITRADTALYEAKESGRNKVCQTEVEVI